jgi:pyruvate kinase
MIFMERKAKIVATIGPSCQEESILEKLILAGMDVARLNFSHGTHEEHAERIRLIRNISKIIGKPVSILQDLQGPKLRVGILPKEGIILKAGQEITLKHVDEDQKLDFTGAFEIPFEVPSLANTLKKGDRILLDDGNLELRVSTAEEQYIKAVVTIGGILLSHKGVNFPGVPLGIPCLTEKDKSDLAFGLEQGVDAIALSFVREAQDITSVSNEINQISPENANIPIIAKLERPEAIDNLDSILDVADGVMVARGDLAVETSPWFVPIVQKKIIRAAYEKSKLVITATQMLESMIHNPRPTRAEASDVANAIFDGTDAVMLSAETASGQYPLESVSMMDSIIKEAEKHTCEWGHCEIPPAITSMDNAVAITRAARELAHDRKVAGIAVFSQSGRTALLMSKARPQVPILGFTPNQKTFQRMSMFWGVTPFLVPYASSAEDMLNIIEKEMLETSLLKPGQQVVIISGFPVGAWRPPNLALLHTIGEKKL